MQRKRRQTGGMLHGPSHEQGGIPARMPDGEMIELEGNEYIINAQTVSALGTEFLDKLNSTSTTYHKGGFQPNVLPGPSRYRNGGSTSTHTSDRRMRYMSPPHATGRQRCPADYVIRDGVCMPNIPVYMRQGGSVKTTNTQPYKMRQTIKTFDSVKTNTTTLIRPQNEVISTRNIRRGSQGPRRTASGVAKSSMRQNTAQYEQKLPQTTHVQQNYPYEFQAGKFFYYCKNNYISEQCIKKKNKQVYKKA